MIERRLEHKDTPMHKLRHLHWPLIIGLGALALVWPVLNLTRVIDAVGRPLGPLMVIAVISLAWLLIVVLLEVCEPLLTLLCTGLIYGVFALAISAVLSPLVDGRLSGLITNPLAIVGVLITSTVWGAIVGAAAFALQMLGRTPRDEHRSND
jgi:hypothetical protein